MAFDFYFAGGLSEDVNYYMRSYDCNILRSYMTERKDIARWIDYKKEGTWNGKLLIDNGAFTVHRKGGVIDIDEYISWINENDEYVDYFIALDDIPGKWGTPRTIEELLHSPEKTWENYLYMYDRVKHPKKLLPVFHQGENFKWLEQILLSGKPDYICISGNKELTNKQREVWYHQCYNYIDKLAPGIKVHCLGSATISNVEKFPFTSMDSTTWIMVGANGNILNEDGRSVIYVGDGGKSLTDLEAASVEKFLNRYNYTLQDVGTNYKARMLFNFRIILDQSKKTETKGLKVKKKGLF